MIKTHKPSYPPPTNCTPNCNFKIVQCTPWIAWDFSVPYYLLSWLFTLPLTVSYSFSMSRNPLNTDSCTHLQYRIVAAPSWGKALYGTIVLQGRNFSNFKAVWSVHSSNPHWRSKRRNFLFWGLLLIDYWLHQDFCIMLLWCCESLLYLALYYRICSTLYFIFEHNIL
jgi:hypothetical protein